MHPLLETKLNLDASSKEWRLRSFKDWYFLLNPKYVKFYHTKLKVVSTLIILCAVMSYALTSVLVED